MIIIYYTLIVLKKLKNKNYNNIVFTNYNTFCTITFCLIFNACDINNYCIISIKYILILKYNNHFCLYIAYA